LEIRWNVLHCNLQTLWQAYRVAPKVLFIIIIIFGTYTLFPIAYKFQKYESVGCQLHKVI